MRPLIIFDLDGTLLYTLDDLANSVNYVLQKHQLPTYPINNYRQFVGNGVTNLIKKAVPQTIHSTEKFTHILNDFLLYYSQHQYDTTHPFDGIVDTLQQLKNQNMLLAVASNKMHEATVSIVEHFFPTISFDIILGQIPQRAIKPNPQIIIDILQNFQLSPQDGIFVGDSNVDILTAHNAQMQAIGVLWGYRNKTELKNAQADFIIQKPMEIIDILKNN